MCVRFAGFDNSGKNIYKSDTLAVTLIKGLLRESLTISNVECHFPYNITVINIGQMTVILSNNSLKDIAVFLKFHEAASSHHASLHRCILSVQGSFTGN